MANEFNRIYFSGKRAFIKLVGNYKYRIINIDFN
jgi:hypothetical protein